MHTTCAVAAGDLSEEGGVRRRHGISGWPDAGRGRRGAPSGRGGSDYMVDAILSAASCSTNNAMQKRSNHSATDRRMDGNTR